MLKVFERLMVLGLLGLFLYFLFVFAFYIVQRYDFFFNVHFFYENKGAGEPRPYEVGLNDVDVCEADAVGNFFAVFGCEADVNMDSVADPTR